MMSDKPNITPSVLAIEDLNLESLDKSPQTLESWLKEGAVAYQQMRSKLLADPEVKTHYEALGKQRELWKQLAEARKEAGISQEQLAKRMGVSQVQVSRLEKKGYQNYTLKSLERYLAALDDAYELEVRIIKKAQTQLA